MAKKGLKAEAARQELVGELTGLKAANLKADGTPNDDAVPQELARIAEIEGKLGIVKAGPSAPAQAPAEVSAEQPAEPVAETATQKVKRLERENAELKAKAGRSREAAKIKSADKKVGHVPRPDEIMDKGLAIAEDTDPANWGDNIKLAVERTIRRFVRKGGSRKNYKGDFYDIPAGFKKGITLAEKEYALGLLEKLGRVKDAKAIIEMLKKRENMPVSAQRQTNKEFNEELEGLGVCWDDSIQVPGMSQQLRS